MKIKKFTAICADHRHNYDPQFPTTYDDIVVINQLDMDLVSLKMKVKVWEDDNEIVFPSETKSKKNMRAEESDVDEHFGSH